MQKYESKRATAETEQFPSAAKNMWLQADALGLGGVWIGIAPLEEQMQTVERLLALPSGQRAFALFAVGYPAKTRPQQDRFDPARIHTVE